MEPLLGDWIVDFSTDPPSCVPGATREAPCTIDISGRDLVAALEDPNLSMSLYFQGRLRVSGDAIRVLQFPAILGRQLLRVPEITRHLTGDPR